MLISPVMYVLSSLSSPLSFFFVPTPADLRPSKPQSTSVRTIMNYLPRTELGAVGVPGDAVLFSAFEN